MNKNIETKFISAWLSSAIATFLLIGAFVFFVDPYGLYRVFEYKGFNQQKEGVRNKIRYVKALELPLRKPGIIILGSSRVHDGINPDNPIFKNTIYGPAYNLGLDMDRIHESLQYLRHAIKNSEIKQVILGLDFFMFDANQRVNFNYDSELVNRKITKWDYMTTPIFSANAFIDSIQTIKISANQPERKEFLPNGFRPGNQVFYGLKNYQGLHYYTNFIFLSSLPSITKYYADLSLNDQVFVDFEEILKICNDNHIDIKVYMSPAHANLDGEGIKMAGKWELMEGWKRRLIQIASRRQVEIWDFSGYNSITTEEVRTPMKYYWDSSHFTQDVGDMILARILKGEVEGVPKDFGVQLNPVNIESHLLNIRNSRRAYVEKNSGKLEFIWESYESFLKGGQMDQKYVSDIF